MFTDEGNWDIVGNDIPVFFIQDAMKFPDVIHSGKPEPDTEIPQAQSAHNNFWDFQFLHSEATHMFMWAMSGKIWRFYIISSLYAKLNRLRSWNSKIIPYDARFRC